MPCELTVEVIAGGQDADRALELIRREASEPLDSEGDRRRFVFPSSECEELKQTLTELLDRETPGWRESVRLEGDRSPEQGG